MIIEDPEPDQETSTESGIGLLPAGPCLLHGQRKSTHHRIKRHPHRGPSRLGQDRSVSQRDRRARHGLPAFEGDEKAWREAQEFYTNHPSILRHFHATGKPTALLCHGPIALAAAVPDAPAFRLALLGGNVDHARTLAEYWPYAGYKMTIFSNSEEKVVEDHILHDKMRFHVVDALEIAGGEVSDARQHGHRVVVKMLNRGSGI
ncbi:hypothetical protein [Ancylobacter defluvii]|uniref:hypothetical protein n=1 Tax=Ancylobacter defluvii TaxID=1282440 RepID=UPI001BCD01F2|nr:hypothetical protein [Ancylobacter defluvii]MBS7590057.1 hypothetical protein [Ancylobacter defluvii]